MRKTMTIAVFALFAAIMTISDAHAGWIDKGRAWLTAEVAALALSAGLAVLGGALGILFGRISRTFREAGEFLTVLGEAIEDRRLTREELSAVISEGRDIFAVWK